MGRVEMRVCSARNVANIQAVGVPDPYVKVSVLDGVTKKPSIFKTKVRKDDLSPVWNELFKFQIADPNKVQIKLELWNDNVFKDDLMGEYELSLNGLEKGVVKDLWVLLKKTKISTSELHVRVLAVDFGDAPEPGAKIVTSMENDDFVHHAAVPNPFGAAGGIMVNCFYTPPNSHQMVQLNPTHPSQQVLCGGGGGMPLPPHLMQAPPQPYRPPPQFGGPPPPQFNGPPPPQFNGPPCGGPPPPQFGGPQSGYGPWSGRPRPYNGGGMQQAHGVPPGAF